MIKTAMQLKAKCRNLAKGNEKAAKAYLRTYFMERFLERVSLSEYREQFVLKGGLLVSSMLGINLRSTMDIDTTVKALSLTESDIRKIFSEILDISIEDGVAFKIFKIERIMEEFDYPGIRIHIECAIDKMRQMIKVDISTDDVITPGAVEYEYKLLFEPRSIRLLAYNTETLLAEKIQTILSRGIANTRMRDFYDVYEIESRMDFDIQMLGEAFEATCKKRATEMTADDIEEKILALSKDSIIKTNWGLYIEKADFAEDIAWEETIDAIARLISGIDSFSEINFS